MKLIKKNDIKLKARRYYHTYGYAIAELVLTEMIDVINPEDSSVRRYYKDVRDKIINKDLT